MILAINARQMFVTMADSSLSCFSELLPGAGLVSLPVSEAIDPILLETSVYFQ